jgi:two-component system chemotaxis sensor kinase CheA
MSVSEVESVYLSAIAAEEIAMPKETVAEQKTETSAGTATAQAVQAAPEKKQAEKTVSKPVVNRSVRVDIEKLDDLMNLVSELIIAKNGLVSVSSNDNSEKSQGFNEQIEYLERVTTNLHESVMKVRMMPIETVTNKFPRMIRDIGQATGKDIELFISGSETSADKKVIEEIKAPLIHIIRNSIDHGIETPEERIAAGKSPKGKIYLIAKNKQNKIIIEIHDDGRGIDLQKIVNRALEKGMITLKEANYLSAEQIMNIIFWPGFSTEQVVTELSGRGVGLDIVQTKINQLNGTVKVFSVPNSPIVSFALKT